MPTPKTISISAKCNDLFSATVLDENGNALFGYLDIDLATGQIINWTKPTQEQLDELNKKD